MTTTTLRTMIAVAALAVAAGSASAQTYRAEVPMAFQAGGKTLAAGSYEVRMGSGAVGQMIVIYSPATKTSAALVSVVRADAPKDWLAAGSPWIRFEQAGRVCSLRNLERIDSSPISSRPEEAGWRSGGAPVRGRDADHDQNPVGGLDARKHRGGATASLAA